MLLPGDLQQLVLKLTGEMDALGLEAFETDGQVQLERPGPGAIKKPADLAPWIEHTMLKPEATIQDIVKLCNEAKRFGFCSVCVNPCFVREARQELTGADCLLVSVIGFPLGATLTSVKVEETREVIKLGADEVDMVIAIGPLKDKDYKRVYQDIRSVVIAASTIPVKVILETALLEYEEKVAACLLAKRAGAAFVKTSTGFVHNGGAKKEDVSLRRAVVGDGIGVKAAGGIRDFNTACEMLKAGANRLGCSSSVQIVSSKVK